MPDIEKTAYRGKHIGFVFQVFNLVPMITLEENISIPLLLQKVDRKIALEKACDFLSDFGMSDKIGVYPRQLSGGQQQRVAIARALIHDPDIIVCDEPTSYLDHATGHKIMDLLRSRVKREKLTCIVVTHDPRIKEYADKIDYLEDGRIVENGQIIEAH